MLLSATNLVNIPEKRKVFNQKIILISILFHSKFFTLYIIYVWYKSLAKTLMELQMWILLFNFAKIQNE